MLHSQEKGHKKFSVKLSVIYSGKELKSEMAKYKRYRLIKNAPLGRIEEVDEFGRYLILIFFFSFATRH